jgi:hypothetical protein
MAQTAPRGSRQGVALSVTLVLAGILATACSSPVAVPSASPRPTPLVTPNPHLGDPATAQDVYNGLGREGLRITPNTANSGSDGGAVITRINATYLGWPLDVIQFRTADDLAKAANWKAGEAPGRGEPPVALAGYNILVKWGPWASGAKPATPDDRQAAALHALVNAMDRLLSPLRTRTVVPVEVASAAAPSSPGPSTAPKATPAP